MSSQDQESGTVAAPSMVPSGGGRSTDHATARDGDAAVREEFEAAERAGTVAAWDLFVARHPDHALAREARLRAQALRGG